MAVGPAARAAVGVGVGVQVGAMPAMDGLSGSMRSGSTKPASKQDIEAMSTKNTSSRAACLLLVSRTQNTSRQVTREGVFEICLSFMSKCILGLGMWLLLQDHVFGRTYESCTGLILTQIFRSNLGLHRNGTLPSIVTRFLGKCNAFLGIMN